MHTLHGFQGCPMHNLLFRFPMHQVPKVCKPCSGASVPVQTTVLDKENPPDGYHFPPRGHHRRSGGFGYGLKPMGPVILERVACIGMRLEKAGHRDLDLASGHDHIPV